MGGEWHQYRALSSSWFKFYCLCKQNVRASPHLQKDSHIKQGCPKKTVHEALQMSPHFPGRFGEGKSIVCLCYSCLLPCLMRKGKLRGCWKASGWLLPVCNYCGRKSLNAWHTFLISGDLRSYFYLIWAWHHSLLLNSFENIEVFHSHIILTVHRGTREILHNYLLWEWQGKVILK